MYQATCQLLRRLLVALLLVGDCGFLVRNRNRLVLATEDYEGSVYFGPLSCNRDLDGAPCQSFSEAFASLAEQAENTAIYRERVVVECGACYRMDHDTENLISFEDGIVVYGKLVFPERSSFQHTLTINTTLLSIHGQLEMYATMKPVDGQPNYKFVMVGSDEQFFQPHPEHVAACGTLCPTGKKAIVVAGGSVHLQGLPAETPTWLHLLDVVMSDGDDEHRPKELVLDTSIYNKWTTGAEILITSHTQNLHDQQVRTIARVSEPYLYPFQPLNGNQQQHTVVNVELDQPIIRPTTCYTDDERFCVEVALLSRNIVFDSGEDEESELHGGHFWILQTPSSRADDDGSHDAVQTIEGIEFRHFGQQGTVGRYPIHFHHCLNGTGSVVSKNSIRDSFQRCVVVHATDNLLIENNVAYNTRGHCYMVEDGVEVNNTFYRNLGALTTAVTHPIVFPPDKQESDANKPSTFWITNPSNYWIENVAAGSEESGFWFELFSRGPYKNDNGEESEPKFLPLYGFIDNVAHSNLIGVRTYPTGYVPLQRAVIQGLKAFRNKSTGIFFHLNKGIRVTHCVFADNGFGVDIDRAEDIAVVHSTFIGRSDSYRNLLQAQPDLKNVCFSGAVTAIELHTLKDNREEAHVIIDNVTFTGFDDTDCKEASPFRFDMNYKIGLFDLLTVISNSQFLTEENRPVASFCSAEKGGIVDVYLTDLDGSLRPASSTTTLPSTLVSNSDINGQAMMRFVDNALSNCIPVADGCYSYCEDTCFTTVRYDVDPGAQNNTLLVCNQLDSSQCIELQSIRTRGDDGTTRSQKLDRFIVHLPEGVYDATFLEDERNPMWPTFVDTIVEENYCGGTTVVDLTELAVTQDQCTELLRNPNLDISDREPTYWLHRMGDGILLATDGQGVDGSNALTNIPGKGKTQFVQYLDSRCLQFLAGRTIKVHAKVKMTELDGTTPFVCIGGGCPVIGFIVEEGYSGYASATSIAYPIARIGEEVDTDGFQWAQGEVVLNSTFTNASRLLFYVLTITKDRLVFVDDMSVEYDKASVPETSKPTSVPTTAPTNAAAPMMAPFLTAVPTCCPEETRMNRRRRRRRPRCRC